jgi:hypothetical protein
VFGISDKILNIILYSDSVQRINDAFEFRKYLLLVEMFNLCRTTRTKSGTTSTALAKGLIHH